jgi:hypothetical protein
MASSAQSGARSVYWAWPMLLFLVSRCNVNCDFTGGCIRGGDGHCRGHGRDGSLNADCRMPECAGRVQGRCQREGRAVVAISGGGCLATSMLARAARVAGEKQTGGGASAMRLRGGFRNKYGESLGEVGQCMNFSRGIADGPRFKDDPWAKPFNETEVERTIHDMTEAEQHERMLEEENWQRARHVIPRSFLTGLCL